MTKAEKMAEEWWNKGADEYDQALFSDRGREMLKELIHQVAERTREECIKAGHKVFLDDFKSKIESWGTLQKAIANAKWEDEEITGRPLE